MIPMKSATKWAPYVVAGTGLYSVKEKYESPTFTDELTQTALGMRGGGGRRLLAVAAGIRWKIASKP